MYLISSGQSIVYRIAFILRLLNKAMEDYTIDVTQIEELQTITNTDELEKIFARAKSAIVNGAKVILVRKEASGKKNKFDELDTQDSLERYRQQVFKYLWESSKAKVKIQKGAL